MAFACDATALDADTRVEHFTWILEELPRLVRQASQLPDGIALELSEGDLPALRKFIERERRCCPFLRFDLVVPAGQETVWLHVIGPHGVKQFLWHVLHLAHRLSDSRR
jgi:hypothetical protein